VLIEQDHAVGLALEEDESVVSVGRLVHGEPLLLEEHGMRDKGLDLIVDPENSFRARHG
jgi:hypothetical protein